MGTNGNPLLFKLPAVSHDACPVQARVSALEAERDATQDEIRALRCAVDEVLGLRRSVESLTIDVKAILARDDAFRQEMALQLKRYAEYTDRNVLMDKRFEATTRRLEVLFSGMRANRDNIEKKTRKARSK